jgi:hypothetical protein
VATLRSDAASSSVSPIVRHVGRDAVAVQEQQVHVGVDAHLAARVAAHGEHAHLGRSLAADAEVVLLREPEQAPDQAVDQVRVRRVDALAARHRGMQLAEVGATGLEVAADGAGDVEARVAPAGRQLELRRQPFVDLREPHCLPLRARCWPSSR